MAEPQTTRSEPQADAILAAAAAGTLAAEDEGGAPAPGLTKRAASAINTFMGWLRDRDPNPAAWMVEPLQRRGINTNSLSDIIERERARHREHLRRMEVRLQRDIPRALEEVGAVQRMREILERERRWLRMHEEAAATRVEGAARKRELKDLSPRGAFWVMSPLVTNHTPDCEALALVGWWPWEALDLIPGPPNHAGCRCFLLTENEARAAGLLGDELPSVEGAVERMRSILQTYTELQEARWVEEHDPLLELQENLRDHAERELEKAGLMDDDSDYGGMLADAVLEIVDVFREQGHSGGSAGMTLELLQKLLSYQPLTPLSSDPEEWTKVGGPGSDFPDMEPMWQNRRQPSAFSKDGGESWYLLEASWERVVRSAIDLLESAEHTTVMVALYPSPELATQLAMKGGEEAKELHVTLTFHGEAEKLGDPEQMMQVVKEWAENTPVLEGEISGWGRFEAGPKPVTYMSIDVPHLSEHREALAQALRDADLPPDDTHGFTPHMTIDYKRRTPKVVEGIPITFDRVTVAWAGEHHSFPLGTTLEEMLAVDLEEVQWNRRYAKGTIYGGRFMPRRGGFAPRIGLGDVLRELGGDISVVGRGQQRKPATVAMPTQASPSVPGSTPGLPDPPGNPFGEDGRGRPGLDRVLDAVANRAREMADEHNAGMNLQSINIDPRLDDTAGHRSWDGQIRVGPEAQLNIDRAAQVVGEGGRLDDDTAGGVYHAYRTMLHEVVHGVNPQRRESYARPADRNLEEAITEEMAHDLAVEMLQDHGQKEALSWAQRHPSSLRAQGVYRPQRAALVAVLDDAEVPLGERRELVRSMAFDVDPDSRFDHLAERLAARKGMDKAMARDRIRGLMERMDHHDPLAPGARVLAPDNPPEGNEVSYRVGATVRVGGRDEPWEGTIRDITVGEDGRFYPEVEVKHADGSKSWRYPDPDDVDVTKEAPRRTLKKGSENVTGTVREGDRVRIKERNGDITVGQLRALHGEDALGWSGEVATDEGEVVMVRPSSIDDIQRARRSSRTRRRSAGDDTPEPPPAPEPESAAAEPQQPVAADLDEELDYSGGSFDARRYQDPRRSLNRKIRALKPGDKVLMADGTEMERGRHGDSVAIRRPDGSRRWYPSVHRATNAEIRGIEERHGVGGRSQALKDDTIASSAAQKPSLPDPDVKLSSAEQKELDDIAKGQASPAIVRKITDTLGFDPYDVDLEKLSEHAELHRRKPRTRMREGSPCARKRDIDFAVHFALPAMLQERYPNAARWLARTSPRWGESHHGEDGHAPLPSPLNRPSLGQASPGTPDRTAEMQAAGATDVDGVEVPGGVIHVGERDGQLVVWDEEIGEPVEATTWVNRQDPDRWLGEWDYAADFWEHGPKELFHATDPENVEAILRDGLQARNETRGMANQSVGGGVFTSPNPSTLEHYGEGRIRIDVEKMRQDGVDIGVTGEPPMVEAQRRGALAWDLGIDSYDARDRHPDLDPETAIFEGDIPPEYLGQASPSEWGDAAQRAERTRAERSEAIERRMAAEGMDSRIGQASPDDLRIETAEPPGDGTFALTARDADGKQLGHITWTPYDVDGEVITDPDVKPHSIDIDVLEVYPAGRRQGIGTRLADELLTRTEVEKRRVGGDFDSEPDAREFWPAYWQRREHGQSSPSTDLTPQERQAAEDWFDYDRAYIVKAASRGEPKPDMGMDGEPITTEEWISAQQDANLLQGLAERGDSGYQQLQRGETWVDPAAAKARYVPGNTIRLDALTAASPNPDVADIYADTEITGGEGRAVLLDIESWDTIPGFERHEGAEVLLPRGLELQVADVLDEPGQPLQVRLVHGDGDGMWSPPVRSGRSNARREQAQTENPSREVLGIPTYDGSELTDLKAAGGSNGARFAEDPEGNRWLVKRYRGDNDRIATELLSNSIYREMGVRVPNAGHTEVPDKDGKVGSALAYPLVDGETRPWKRPSGALADGFVVDALLANWDVVGLGMDNVLWDGEDPIRVDQGGTLQFRAMGEVKPFGPVPTELWTMNKPGGQAFGRMDISEPLMRTSAADAADRLTPERIDALVDEAPFEDEKMRGEVRQALKDRVAWLGRYARGEEQLPEPLEGQEVANYLDDRDRELLLDPETEEAMASYLSDPSEVDEYLQKATPKKGSWVLGGRSKEAKPSAEVAETIELLDDLFSAEETEIDEEIVVYLGETTGVDPAKSLGKQVRSRGYLRAQFGATEGTYSIRVRVPEGAHVVRNGGDVLLPRGQKLHIVGESTPGLYEAAAAAR